MVENHSFLVSEYIFIDSFPKVKENLYNQLSIESIFSLHNNLITITLTPNNSWIIGSVVSDCVYTVDVNMY